MRSSRCSESGRTVPAPVSALAVLAVTVAVVLAAIPVPAAAVSTTASGVPDDAEVGTEVESTFTLTDLYEDGVDRWQLRANTELTGVSWTVEKRKLNGDVVRESYGGSSFETTVDADEDVDRVTITVTGTVPEIDDYSYDPRERFAIARLVRIKGENENQLGRWTVHHYTAESREARQAIDDAREVVGDDAPADAQRDVEQAISAYEAGNFPNAIDNAEAAAETARDARRARERTQLLLYAGLGVLALVAVFGGFYYYRSRQETYDRLR